MTNRFEDLWATAASDGAVCPCGVGSPRVDADDREELDLLMNAWHTERAGHIECALALQQAGRMIALLLADADVSPARRRRAKRLIGTIRALRDESQT